MQYSTIAPHRPSSPLAIAACTLVCVALVGVSSPALAQRDAEAMIERGVALREQGDDAGARDLFREAFESSGSPRALAQLALAEQALGLWVEAHGHLTEALQSRARWIRRNRRALAGALETINEHIGILRVRGGVDGARVLVDGVERGVLPLENPLQVSAGTMTVQVAAEGYGRFERSIQIIGGQSEELEVELEEARADAVPDAAPQRASSSASSAPAAAASGGGSDPAPWIVVGVSGAVLAGGVVMLVLGRLDAGAVENAERGTRWEDVAGAAERATPLTLAGSVALGVGAAGIALGVVWAMLADESADEAGVHFGPGAVWGRF